MIRCDLATQVAHFIAISTFMVLGPFLRAFHHENLLHGCCFLLLGTLTLYSSPSNPTRHIQKIYTNPFRYQQILLKFQNLVLGYRSPLVCHTAFWSIHCSQGIHKGPSAASQKTRHSGQKLSRKPLPERTRLPYGS